MAREALPSGGRPSEGDSSSRSAAGNSTEEGNNSYTIWFGVKAAPGDYVRRASGAVEGQDRTLRYPGIGGPVAATRGLPEEVVGAMGGGDPMIGGRKPPTRYTSAPIDPEVIGALREQKVYPYQEFEVTHDALPATQQGVHSPITGKIQYGTEGYYDARHFAAHPSENLESWGTRKDYENLYDALAEAGEGGPRMDYGQSLSRMDADERVLLSGPPGDPRLTRPVAPGGRSSRDGVTWRGGERGGVINEQAPVGWDQEEWGRKDPERYYEAERRAERYAALREAGPEGEQMIRYERLRARGLLDMPFGEWREKGMPSTRAEIDAVTPKWRKALQRVGLQRKFDRGGVEDAWQMSLWIARAPEAFVMRYLRFGGPIGLAALSLFSRDATLLPAIVKAAVTELSKKGRPLNQDWQRMSGTTYDMMSLERQHHREQGDEPLLLAEAAGYHPRDSYYSSWEEVDRLRIRRGAQDYDTVGLSQRVITWGY